MSSWGSKDAQIWISNGLKTPVYVMVAPSAAWTWIDALAKVALEDTVVAPVAAGADIIGGAWDIVDANQDGFSPIKSLDGLARILSQLQEIKKLNSMAWLADAYSGLKEKLTQVAQSLPDDPRVDSSLNKIKEFLGANSQVIQPGDSVLVATQNFLQFWDALNPSYWAALSGAATAHVMIVSEDLQCFSSFDTDPDYSWIVAKEGVVRARYGTVWDPRSNEGFHAWGGCGSTRSSLTSGSGDELTTGQSLQSPNGNYQLVLQADGNLVLIDTRGMEVVWSSQTKGLPITRAWYDGELHLGTKDATLRTLTTTEQNMAGYLKSDSMTLTDEGILKGHGFNYPSTYPVAEEKIRWTLFHGRGLRSQLAAGEYLLPKQDLQSDDRQYRLVMQADGNLVLLRNNSTILWMSGTAGRGDIAIFQPDGNLVVYVYTPQPVAMWASSWDGGSFGDQYAGSTLRLQKDSNLCAYDRNSNPFWDTMHHPKMVLTIIQPPPPAALPGDDKVVGTVLQMGQKLLPGQALRSTNKGFYLLYRPDGELMMLRSDGFVFWSAQTAGRQAGNLSMQEDGNLVVYEPSGNPVWASGSNGGKWGSQYGNSMVRMQDDGNLVVYAADGSVLWASNTNQPLSAGLQGAGSAVLGAAQGVESTPTPLQSSQGMSVAAQPAGLQSAPVVNQPTQGSGSVLQMGQNLLAGQQLQSNNRLYQLIYQPDGNLVIYTQAGRVLWATNTAGTVPGRFSMQDDGNVVVYDAAGGVVWAGDRSGGKYGPQYRGSQLQMQDDGNLVVYAADGSVLWASNTYQGQQVPQVPQSAPMLTPAPTPIPVGSSGLASAAQQSGPAGSLQLAGGYLALPPIPGLGYAGGSAIGFSVEAWVQINTATPWGRIIDFGVGPGADTIALALGPDPSTLIVETISQPSPRSFTSPGGAVQPGVWMHLCLVVDGAGNATIYKNGFPIAQGVISYSNVTRGSCLVGMSNWPRDPTLPCNIAELRIWNGARVSSDVRAGMGQRLIGNEGGLLGYYRMSEGGPLPSVKGACLNAAANGAPLGDAQANGACAWSPVAPQLPSEPPVPPPVVAPPPMPLPPQGPGGVMALPASLAPGQGLQSPNGKYKLVLQLDGNLVLSAQDGRVLWSSNTANNPPGNLAIQDNGSLLLTAGNGAPMWSSPLIPGVPSPAQPPPVVAPPPPVMPSVPPSVVTAPPVPGATGSLALAGGYAKLPPIPSLGFGSPGVPQAGFTLEAWVLVNAMTPWARIFDLGAGPGSDNIAFAAGPDPSTLLVETISQPSPRSLISPSGILQPGVWTHIGLTVDPAGNAILYKNGAPVAQGQVAYSNVMRASSLLGKSNWPQDPTLNANLAEVRIWGLVRPQADIASTIAGSLKGNENGLLAYWKMTDGSPTTAKDFCTNGPGGTALYGDATLVGTCSWSPLAPSLSTAPPPPVVVQPPMVPPPVVAAPTPSAPVVSPPVVTPPTPVVPPPVVTPPTPVAPVVPPPVVTPPTPSASVVPPPVVTPPTPSASVVPPPPTPFVQALAPMQAIQSPSGQFLLVLRDDGNFILCDPNGNVLWSANTSQP